MGNCFTAPDAGLDLDRTPMAVGRVPPFVPPPGQNIEREEVSVPVVRAQENPQAGEVGVPVVEDPPAEEVPLGPNQSEGVMMLYYLRNIVEKKVVKEGGEGSSVSTKILKEGSSASAKILKGSITMDGDEGKKLQVCILKKANPADEVMLEAWLDEMRLVNAAGHDNIHRMLGYCNEETGFYVVSESMTENLRNLISEKKKILAWEERVEIALACAKAMSALHSLPIPSGFVVFRSSKVPLDHDLRPKLCGFGVTMVELAGHGDIVSKALRQEKKGLYEAPEYRATGLRSTKTDVYSFGVVLGELFTGVVAGHRSPKIVNHTIVSFLKSNAELLGDFTADEREAVSGLLTEEYIIKRNEGKTDVKVFVDDELKEYPKIGAANILNLIGRCLDDDSDKRPTMEIVVKELGNLLWRFHGEK